MLAKNKSKLGVVRNAEHNNIIIQPNLEVVSGYIDQDLLYKSTVYPTNQAAIPEDIDIAPTLLDYSYKNTSPVDVHISNVTTKTVVIPPRGILCEIQPVTIEHDTEMNQEESNIFDYINIDTSTISEDQHSQLFEMIKKFEDIFFQKQH